MIEPKEVEYERLLEVLKTTNSNNAKIDLHISTEKVNNEDVYNITCSTGYMKYKCTGVYAYIDVFWDLDDAVKHLPSECFIK